MLCTALACCPFSAVFFSFFFSLPSSHLYCTPQVRNLIQGFEDRKVETPTPVDPAKWDGSKIPRDDLRNAQRCTPRNGTPREASRTPRITPRNGTPREVSRTPRINCILSKLRSEVDRFQSSGGKYCKRLIEEDEPQDGSSPESTADVHVLGNGPQYAMPPNVQGALDTAGGEQSIHLGMQVNGSPKLSPHVGSLRLSGHIPDMRFTPCSIASTSSSPFFFPAAHGPSVLFGDSSDLCEGLDRLWVSIPDCEASKYQMGSASSSPVATCVAENREPVAAAVSDGFQGHERAVPSPPASYGSEPWTPGAMPHFSTLQALKSTEHLTPREEHLSGANSTQNLHAAEQASKPGDGLQAMLRGNDVQMASVVRTVLRVELAGHGVRQEVARPGDRASEIRETNQGLIQQESMEYDVVAQSISKMVQERITRSETLTQFAIQSAARIRSTLTAKCTAATEEVDSSSTVQNVRTSQNIAEDIAEPPKNEDVHFVRNTAPRTATRNAPPAPQIGSGAPSVAPQRVEIRQPNGRWRSNWAGHGASPRSRGANVAEDEVSVRAVQIPNDATVAPSNSRFQERTTPERCSISVRAVQMPTDAAVAPSNSGFQERTVPARRSLFGSSTGSISGRVSTPSASVYSAETNVRPSNPSVHHHHRSQSPTKFQREAPSPHRHAAISGRVGTPSASVYSTETNVRPSNTSVLQHHRSRSPTKFQREAPSPHQHPPPSPHQYQCTPRRQLASPNQYTTYSGLRSDLVSAHSASTAENYSKASQSALRYRDSGAHEATSPVQSRQAMHHLSARDVDARTPVHSRTTFSSSNAHHVGASTPVQFLPASRHAECGPRTPVQVQSAVQAQHVGTSTPVHFHAARHHSETRNSQVSTPQHAFHRGAQDMRAYYGTLNPGLNGLQNPGLLYESRYMGGSHYLEAGGASSLHQNAASAAGNRFQREGRSVEVRPETSFSIWQGEKGGAGMGRDLHLQRMGGGTVARSTSDSKMQWL